MDDRRGEELTGEAGGESTATVLWDGAGGRVID